MPLLGFGTWQIKGEEAVTATAAALDAGYRHLDTATVYGNEGEVGRALGESGVPRDDVFVTTKCPPSKVGHELETLRESLDLLGTDHVDLWLIHWPGGDGTDVDVWRAFGEAREAGLARDIGVSNFDAARHRRARRGHRRGPGGQPGRVEPPALRRRCARRAPRARHRPGGLQRAARRHLGAPDDHRHRGASRAYAGAGDRPLAPPARRSW